MDPTIKVVGELDRLVTESTSQTLLKPNLGRFRRIADLINSSSTVVKPFVNLIKTKLSSAKHPKTQLLLLELIEYTTCKCGQQLHNEFNSKSFLQMINSLFNQKQLASEVTEKALGLIQFWDRFFEQKRDILGNFAWYFANISKRGIPFPPYKNSPYLEPGREKAPIQPPNEYAPVQQTTNLTADFDERQKKLFKDLNVVLDNVRVANSMIDEKDLSVIDEVMVNLKSMEKKLLVLPDKLSRAGEDFLYRFCLAVIEDIGVTIDRHYRMVSKLSVPKFSSKADAVTDEAKKQAQRPAQQEPAYPTFEERQAPAPDPFSQTPNTFYKPPEQNENLLIDVSDPFGIEGTSKAQPQTFGGPAPAPRPVSPNALNNQQWGFGNAQPSPPQRSVGLDIDFTQTPQPTPFGQPAQGNFGQFNQLGAFQAQQMPFGNLPPAQANAYQHQPGFAPSSPNRLAY